jgi:hypothetical protein
MLTTGDSDFLHTLHGIKEDGTLSYMTKTAFTHFEVSGTIDSSEGVIIGVSRASTADAKYSARVEKGRKLTLQITTLLGASEDLARVRVDVETEKARTITMAPRPGLGTVDLGLVDTKAVGNVDVQFMSMVEGKQTGQASHVDPALLIGGAMRLKTNPGMLGQQIDKD